LAIALSSRGFLDLGELGGRQLGVGTGGTAAAQGIHPALEVAAVPAVGALAGHAELVGDLGLGAALGEQLGRLEPSGLKSTLFGWAGGRHRRALIQQQPSVNPTDETQIVRLVEICR
jgi:hypothetical protein